MTRRLITAIVLGFIMTGLLWLILNLAGNVSLWFAHRLY